MNRRRIVVVGLGVAAVMACVWASGVGAQVGRSRIESDEYRVRIVNELGEWVRVGMIGYQRDANLRVEINDGSSWTGQLYGGQRVVVAWDRRQNLIFASEVLIGQNGTLRLQQVYALGAADPTEDAQRKATSRTRQSPLPMMKMEP
jgi:hypothetical protein